MKISLKSEGKIKTVLDKSWQDPSSANKFVCFLDSTYKGNHLAFAFLCRPTWRSTIPSTAQVANTRPSTLFYPTQHLISTRRQHQALTLLLRSSYIYIVLKLHLALWKQPWGWCGPWWKWIWHPCYWVHPCCCRWQDFIGFYGWIIFHCTYAPLLHLLMGI